ncbi:YbhB/YbcL family Raf kinase inhibitor-like protein [Rhizobium gallicum]|uniref:YbhB/YbcL family Raf kinase inhibitor-like protein n=1 Tax=Rhizobium gallicum TaxID=56730 RepID=UPI001EF95D2E|nr:YbhB/YbcL family Raf kinase inhibitor-like protein [Rhizobium gallicum]ULJ72389.1 YbhB/YbcL family Raf kinase inhibitor-like protein [Rhizobium gallicum]
MKRCYLRCVSAVLVAAATTARADDARLSVKIEGLDQTGRLMDQAAFCPPPSSSKKDISPAVSWSTGPKGTRSYALLMTDPDVPQDLSKINKNGAVIRTNDPRITVFHWVLADIPAGMSSLAQGVESQALVPHGKPIGETDHGRRGANVYTSFLSSNPDLAGTYGGYDGPCPPMNDERPHHYALHIYALDVATLDLNGAFDGAALEKAIRGHVLAEGVATATYSLNPDLAAHAAQQ